MLQSKASMTRGEYLGNENWFHINEKNHLRWKKIGFWLTAEAVWNLCSKFSLLSHLLVSSYVYMYIYVWEYLASKGQEKVMLTGTPAY